MRLKELINTNNWLSVEATLLSLYPDQKVNIDGYKAVFELLSVTEPIQDELIIVLTEQENSDEPENEPIYVDVSGKKSNQELKAQSESYALEFVRWEKWLGMEVETKTLRNFNELEIISHCLFEMTFCGYEQSEIQDQLESLNKSVDDYKNLSKEEKDKSTISFEEFKRKLGLEGSS